VGTPRAFAAATLFGEALLKHPRTTFGPRLLMTAPFVLAACMDLNKSPSRAGSTLADRHPCDQGIASDPDVVWAESFEEGSVSAVTSRYNDYKNAAGMTLVAERPLASCGRASMKLTAGGAVSATDLYKLLPDHAELYVRWYVKYQTGAPWHHTGVWFGGDTRHLTYPDPHAGQKPNGDDRVSFAMEPVWGVGGANPRFDFYNYWMKMRTCDNCGGFYWGNALVSRNGFTADDDTWDCIEVHAKLNTDMASGADAGLEVWKNDALIQTFPDAAGLGYWVQDHFCPAGADGSQCNYSPTASGPVDLQFRTTTALQLNYFWPQDYVTDSTPSSVWFDDMVVATTRIGCLR